MTSSTRSYLMITAAICAFAVSLACSSKLSKDDIEKIRGVVQDEQEKSRRPRAGDDDAPVTMLGGSLSIGLAADSFWKPVSGTQNQWNHSDTVRVVKRVDFWDQDKDPTPYYRKTDNSAPWEIVVDYKGGKDRPVTFASDNTGSKLNIQSDGKMGLYAFRRYSEFLMEHPREAKIKEIVLKSGAEGSPVPLTCTKGDCGLLIHYCIDDANHTPATKDKACPK